MANIQSQIKRNARSLRERHENRQYTSQIKTYFRRLETAVEAGDDEQADAEHRTLVKLIDKAVKRGALHANTGARKKSRAARLRRSAEAAPAARGRAGSRSSQGRAAPSPRLRRQGVLRGKGHGQGRGRVRARSRRRGRAVAPAPGPPQARALCSPRPGPAAPTRRLSSRPR